MGEPTHPGPWVPLNTRHPTEKQWILPLSEANTLLDASARDYRKLCLFAAGETDVVEAVTLQYDGFRHCQFITYQRDGTATSLTFVENPVMFWPAQEEGNFVLGEPSGRVTCV